MSKKSISVILATLLILCTPLTALAGPPDKPGDDGGSSGNNPVWSGATEITSAS